MDVIALYPGTMSLSGPPLTAFQEVEPLAQDGTCTECSMHKDCLTVCMPARCVSGLGSGRLLVVGESPSQTSDRYGRAFEGTAERWFVSMLRRHWQGDVVFDYAIKCAVRKRTLNQTYHDHCRPYLADTFEDVEPDRVILLGNHAAKGLLGYSRGGAAHCNRRAYTWIYHDGVEIPAFILSKPDGPSQNRFLRAQFEEDLRWALKANPPQPPLDAVTFAVHPTEEDAARFLAWLEGSSWLSFDVETYGEHFRDDFRILTVGVSIPGTFDCFCFDAAALAPGTPTREALRVAATSAAWVKKGQNVKYDHQSLRLGLGIDPTPVAGDSRLLYKLINPDGDAALDQMAEMVGMGGHKQEANVIVKAEARRLRKEWRAENRGKDIRNFRAMAYAYAALPRDVNLRYVSRDALSTRLLIEKFERTLQNAYDGVLWDTYERTVNPASVCITNVEHNGLAISADAVRAFGTTLLLQIHKVADRLASYGEGERTLNPASPSSVSRFLYEDLKIKPTQFTKTGKPSTAKAVLERMSSRHPAVADILEWRKLSKLETTYVSGLLPYITSDGRIHPSLLLDGTGTGRLSCREPNLQNIATRGELAKELKRCFAAPLSRFLLQADYGTLEIRVAALLSGDPLMSSILQSGADFHLETAKAIGMMVWGMTPAEVEAEFRNGDSTKRSIAKTINFGTLYGQAPFALALQISAIIGTEFPESLAEKAQVAILGKFAVLRQWIADCRRYTTKTGEAWTFWDGAKARRRPLYDAGYADGGRAGSALRSSFNTPVQGSGSDYCLMSLVAVEEALRELFGPRAFPVMTVHDSIIIELDEDMDLLADVVGLMHDIMVGWWSGDVPLTVDFEAGYTWGTLNKIKVVDGDIVGAVDLGERPQ